MTQKNFLFSQLDHRLMSLNVFPGISCPGTVPCCIVTIVEAFLTPIGP